MHDFVGNMGVTETERQRKHIALYSQLLTEQLEESKEAVCRKCKLYQVLPLSAALVLSLMLI